MILSGQTIRRICNEKDMISPFHERTVNHGMTFGLGPAGYDIRIKHGFVLIPDQFALASSIEFFNMPTNIAAVVMDKSSYARQGLTVFNTFIEPGWKGFLTLELKNLSNQLLTIPSGAPIAQIVFHLMDQETEAPYKGKYQNQPDKPVPSLYEHKL
jgi:dCTP deaminase